MAREKFPSDDIDRLMVRLPPGMRNRLKDAAEANKRSLSSEITARLEASFEDRPVVGPVPIGFLKDYIQIYAEFLAEGHIKGFMEGSGIEPMRDDETRKADQAKEAKRFAAKVDEMMKGHLHSTGAKPEND